MHSSPLAILIGFMLILTNAAQPHCNKAHFHHAQIPDARDCITLISIMPTRTVQPPHIEVPALIKYGSCALTIEPLLGNVIRHPLPNTEIPTTLFFQKAKGVAIAIIDYCDMNLENRWTWGSVVMNGLAGKLDEGGSWRTQYLVSLRASGLISEGYNSYEFDRSRRVVELERISSHGGYHGSIW